MIKYAARSGLSKDIRKQKATTSENANLQMLKTLENNEKKYSKQPMKNYVERSIGNAKRDPQFLVSHKKVRKESHEITQVKGDTQAVTNLEKGTSAKQSI